MNKKIIKAMLIYISYFIYDQFLTLPLSLVGIDYNGMSLVSRAIYVLIYNLIYILILVFLYRDTFKKDLKKYIKNFKKDMPKYLDYWAISYALMMGSSIVINLLIPQSTATNQEILDNLFTRVPFYVIISSVLFAPIMEETIFRLCLRNVFKSDKTFIIISGFVFGALHVVGSFESFADLAQIIPYSIPGFVFAYTLVKSKNIFIPISLHFFHNAFMTLTQILPLFFR